MGLGRHGVDMDHAQELVEEDTRHVLVDVTTRHGTTLALIVPVEIAVNMTHFWNNFNQIRSEWKDYILL
jgi:hypothetical protein